MDDEGLFVENSDISEDSSGQDYEAITSKDGKDVFYECGRCGKPFDTSQHQWKHQEKCGVIRAIDSNRYHSHCHIPGSSLHLVRNRLSGADCRIHVNVKTLTCTSFGCRHVSGLSECPHVRSCRFPSEQPRICSFDETHGHHLLESKEIDRDTFKHILNLSSLCTIHGVPLCLELSENPTLQRNFSVALFAPAGNLIPNKRCVVSFAYGKGECATCKLSTCLHVLIARWAMEEYPFEVQPKVAKPTPDPIIERYLQEKGFRAGKTPPKLPTELFPSETCCPYGCGTDCLLVPDLSSVRPKWTQVLLNFYETCNVRVHRKKCPKCNRLVYYKDSDLGLFNHEDTVMISHYLLKITIALMKKDKSTSGVTYQVIKDTIGPRLRIKEQVFDEAIGAYKRIVSQ